MDNTKHDLSYDEAKLDYNALLSTAKMAVGSLLESASQRINQIRDACLKLNEDNLSSLYLRCDWLKDDADSLAIAGETLATLIGGLTRSNIILVNKGVTV